MKICEDGNLYSCCLRSEIRIPILLVGFPYDISFRRCSRFQTGTRKFDAPGNGSPFYLWFYCKSEPWRLAPSSSHENHEWLDLFAHHHIVFALYGQGSKIKKHMNTIYYLQKIVKHMINLNNISIVFPNSSYKQIQMSGSKKTTPTT